MSENTNEQPTPPIKIAFILDGEVVDVLHTDERLASIFLSNPTVINVTGEDGSQTAFFKDKYDAETNTFTRPEPINEETLLLTQQEPDIDNIDEQVGFEGWVYDETLGHHVPPIPYPTDGKLYNWDNATINWIEATR